MAQMSLGVALKELKSLKARIAKAQDEVFVTVIVGDKNKKENADTIRLLTSNWDSAKGLIDRYEDIKSKLTTANATTQVMIAGRSISLAEAIEIRTQVIPMMKVLLRKVDLQKAAADQRVQTDNAQVEANAIKLFTNESKDVNLELVRQYEGERNRFTAFPPQVVGGYAEMRTFVDEFEVQVDAEMNRANAVTFIEV